AEDDRTDLALFQVQRKTERAVLELQQFVRHRRGKALDLRDAVTGLADRADLFARGRVRLVRLDEVLQRVPDLLRPDRELRHLGSLLSLLGPKSLGVWGCFPQRLCRGPPAIFCNFCMTQPGRCSSWWPTGRQPAN